jgi:hypothetical protein
MPPKAHRRFDPRPGDPRPDPTPPRLRPMSVAVITFVGVDRARAGTAPPRRRPNRRNGRHHGLEQDGVVDVGRGHHCRQGEPAVAGQVGPGSRLARIDGSCAHLVPRAWPARSCVHGRPRPVELASLAVPWARRDRRQGLDDRPQLVRHKVVGKSGEPRNPDVVSSGGGRATRPRLCARHPPAVGGLLANGPASATGVTEAGP